MQDALRHLVATILKDVGAKGLPGEHHFYIGFLTRYSGVHISDRLLKDYPDEMVIVLRNQFENLKVLDDSFEVTLYFSGIAETLHIPFKAVSRFDDPSADFTLGFDVELVEGLSALPPATPKLQLADHMSSEELNSVETELSDEGESVDTKPTDETPDEAETNAGAKVVSLDQFRKA